MREEGSEGWGGAEGAFYGVFEAVDGGGEVDAVLLDQAAIHCQVSLLM